jgi:hypothetical protein
VCFGKHAVGSAICRRVHAEDRVLSVRITKQKRAQTINHRIYVDRQCPVLAQRITWFSQQLKEHPNRRSAYRKRALASSHSRWRAQHCGHFGHLDSYFAGQLAKSQVELEHLIKTYS